MPHHMINTLIRGMVIAVLAAVLVEASSPLNEAQALMAFKAGISKDPLGILKSWHATSNNSSPCREGAGGRVATAWAGIVCGSRKLHVITLNLRSCSLSGSISPSLAFLPALSRLDLSDNSLNGSLSSTLFDSIPGSSLQYLNLSNNLLEGKLPHSLANLSALREIDLSYNKFAGIMPPSWGQLKNLEVLFLEETGLTGDIDKEIWQLPAVRELWITDNTFGLLNITLPDNFTFCSTITQLVLGGFSAGGSAIPSSLGNCRNLEILVIHAIKEVGGFIPAQIWQLPLLQILKVKDNSFGNLRGVLPDSFASCSTISYLHLEGFNATGSSIPSSLGACHQLNHLVFNLVGLQGLIPPQIWQLPSLLALSVVDTVAIQAIDGLLPFKFSLYGQLPSNFSFCPSIQVLQIDGVGLTGDIPSSLGLCTSLQVLDLSHSYIQGTIPNSWQNLTNLQFFYLQGNNLTGGIPASLSACSQLEALKLGENVNLSTSIPIEFGELTQLQSVSLAGPMTEALCNCTQLSWLDMAWRSVQSGMGNLPDCMARLAQLQVLALHYNLIDGEVARKVVSNLTQLYYLDMSFAQMRASIPQELGNLSQLQHLSFRESELTGPIPTGIAQLLLIEKIDLSINNISGTIPDELGVLPELQFLDLSENNLLGPLPKSLDNCSNLQELHLYKNDLTGGIEHFDFSKLSQLQRFAVQQNNFVGGLPSSFTNTSSLVVFQVQGNKLSGSFDSNTLEIGGLSNLRLLVVSYNNLSGTIPGWVWKLPMLQGLDISNNHFSGTMPTTVSTLTYFKQNQSSEPTLFEKVPLVVKSTFQVLPYVLNDQIFFDVSMNHFEGEIAESFGELLGLTALNLSHNRIQGKIPASLGKLANLEYVDLSHNNLSGEIPQELGYLSGLSVVDLSYNNLQGPIPTTNYFDTRFNNASFVHNPRLCGAPLSTYCPNTDQQAQSNTPFINAGAKPTQSAARQVIDRISSFASLWGLLAGYIVGFLGVLYLLHYIV